MPWGEGEKSNKVGRISWGDSHPQLPSRAEGARSHRFRGRHLEVNSYDFVPVILRQVKQKLIPGNARTGHNDGWRASKAGLWKREVTHQKTTNSQGRWRQCERFKGNEVARVHLHLFQQAPGRPGLRHVSLEGSVRPLLAPRPAQQLHRLPCRCPVQVASGHCSPFLGQAHTDCSADAAARTCGRKEHEGVGNGEEWAGVRG